MTDAVHIHPALPVFRIDPGATNRSILYVPGHVMIVTRRQADLYEDAIRNEAPGEQPLAGYCGWLVGEARRAVAEWSRRVEAPFVPECLTLYLSNMCNAACTYCFAERLGPRARSPANPSGPVVSSDAVAAAARLVARNCNSRGLPFHLVVHGGGEPTIHWDLVQKVHALSRDAAQTRGIAWKGYIATNGVLAAAKARWLGANFDKVGLSCDGPPELHDMQRPVADGSPSSRHVVRTAEAVKDAGATLEVRATVTALTMRRQVEMVRYFRDVLHADEVRLEPVYSFPGARIEGIALADVAELAEHMLAAHEWASHAGLELSFSGARLEEVHGPFCDVLRQTLHLTPDSHAVDCFFCVSSAGERWRQHVIGWYDESQSRFVIDTQRAASARRAAGAIPEACQACINAYHCARGCPERCLSEHDREQSRDVDAQAWQVRCALARKLTSAWLCRMAMGHAGAGAVRMPGASGSVKMWEQDDAHRDLWQLLGRATPEVDADAIVRSFGRLGRHRHVNDHRMPPPLWALRGFDRDGSACWQSLEATLARRTGPLSVYVHIPFCDRRCGFCDCLSHRVRRQDAGSEGGFVDTLIEEIDAWSRRGQVSQRPVTTVHFGGGTPGALAPKHFARIIAALRSRLGIVPTTEWAIESTGTCLSPEMLAQLKEQGFSRLHVGVQTLEEGLRQRIGRRQRRAEVLTRIEAALVAGFVTSVDLVYGLPGETLAGFVRTLADLQASGVHGVSLYALNRSARNEAFLRKAGPLPGSLQRYAFFQAGEQILVSRSYVKNHLSHYARYPDEYLYYRHRIRGEDLLGLGPSADGVIGDCHFRHLDWPEYWTAGADSSHLQGGVRETDVDARVEPVVSALMCGGIDPSALRDAGVERLLDDWLEEGLAVRSTHGDLHDLTANGSWFAGQMIEAVRALAGRQWTG
jgi:oxygen-independent coproporphyrinogen-3 oxidase